MLNLCLGVFQSTLDSMNAQKAALDAEYQNCYKPILRFLKDNIDVKVFFTFTGVQLEYYKKHHGEFFSILKDLYNCNKIEVLGAGFFNPIFPLLFPRERVLQLELFTNFMRDNLGKKPRGLAPSLSAWDFSLLNTFSAAGFDYVLLDSNATLHSAKLYGNPPFLMTDKAKSLTIFTYEGFQNIPKNISPKDWLNNILQEYTYKSDCVKIYFFTPDQIAQLINDNFLQGVCDIVCDKPFMQNIPSDSSVKLVTPYEVFQNIKTRTPIYIPSCVNISLDNNNVPAKNSPLTIFDYLYNNAPQKLLNDRVTYEALLLNQNRLDKVTKDNARKLIMASQNANFYTANSFTRMAAYKMLSQAEKILHNSPSFKPSVTKFDYNGDGLIEYIAREKTYFCIINNLGNIIDIEATKKPTANYVDGGSLFCDFLNGKEIAIYKEEKFSFSYTKEIFLKAMISNSCDNFIIKKKLLIRENSMTVQYIIKNDSAKSINTTFAVKNSLIKDIVFNNEVIIAQNTVAQANNDTKNIYPQSSAIQIMDDDSQLSLIFEPNEPCTVNYSENNFFTLSWDLQLMPNGETEKTINFYILSLKKR